VAASVEKYESKQTKRPIYNGRPLYRSGPPVVIYDKSLAQLEHDLTDLSDVVEPPAKHVETTAKLFCAAAPIYDSQRERREAMYGHLSRLLGASLSHSVQEPEVKSNKYSAEGGAVVQELIRDETFGKKNAVVAYIELNNELGLSGDGGLRAALSLRKHIAQQAVELFMITLDILSLTYGRL
jgi:hypothetical protein